LTERAFHVADPRGARSRLIVAILVGVAAWIAASGAAPLTRLLIAGDVGGAALLSFALAIILRADADETRRRAAAEDPGRTLVWLIVLVVSALTLFAATFLLHSLSADTGKSAVESLTLPLVLTVVAAVLSWFLTHTAFTLRYAHLYYREGRAKEGGIVFPADDDDADDRCAPDDRDFMYFAFTLGMCFQVSDATITSRLIRRTALFHAMVSFAFNTGIIAFVLSLVTR